ncbi:B12-binding domain-containing radical SAM protein [Streptomyces sp. NPDC058954]|uniref:B12-binding domain-containing radical SAM protein n=1 Tax=Streptomyces sp. NPDC058954 TaxID=3346677 RepID=UPI0036974B86
MHITADATHSYSHGVAALAGELRRGGLPYDSVGVSVIDASVEADAYKIAEEDPDIVLISAMSNQWGNAKRVGEIIKSQNPRISIGVGGSHVTAAPHSVRKVEQFDFLVAGEADHHVLDIVRNPPRDGAVIFCTAPEDLNATAMPALDLFTPSDLKAYPSVMFSRGCPFKCTYCMSRLGGTTGRVRWKSPERAIEEVHSLLERSEADRLYIDDDTLLKNPRWVRDFAARYQNEISVPFYCNARPETVRADLVETMVAAGCAGIGIGIESGSPRLRAEVLQRKMDDHTIVEAFRIAKNAGLFTWSFNMIGLPSESLEDVQSLISLNERCQVDSIRLSVFTPYPGTPLGAEVDVEQDHPSYFKTFSDLPVEKIELIRPWFQSLSRQGKLWYTETELPEF